MPFIEFQQRLYRLKDGDNFVGSDHRATIRLPGLDGEYPVAISVEGFGAFVWAAQDAGNVAINGRPLGHEPIPLFNGDRLSVNGSLLVFVDDGGEATVKIDAPVPAAVAQTAVQSNGGTAAVAPELMRRITPPEEERRVVAVLRRLDNNQSYIIGRSSFRIGREKRCDLIIPDRKISRLHAEITFNRGQYLLRDLGRTATKVNGRKVGEPYKLQVGDTIQIGRYQFTFVRRVATAEDIVQENELTPVRGVVPDAITLGRQAAGSPRVLSWLLFLVAAGTAALILLT
ncbi:MAG: FHA domain-containing protein [Gemmatimonadota bacterium]|nr:MAG: FHA domain-containing protein [Gemmatimonadota bacterium]